MSDQAQIMSVTESKRPSYVTTSIDADNKIMPHSNIIKIRGLSNNVTVDHLREIFSVYGCLKRVSLPVDVHTRELKGYAFVEFIEAILPSYTNDAGVRVDSGEKNETSASTAIRCMNGGHLDGKTLEVTYDLQGPPSQTRPLNSHRNSHTGRYPRSRAPLNDNFFRSNRPNQPSFGPIGDRHRGSGDRYLPPSHASHYGRNTRDYGNKNDRRSYHSNNERNYNHEKGSHYEPGSGGSKYHRRSVSRSPPPPRHR